MYENERRSKEHITRGQRWVEETLQYYAREYDLAVENLQWDYDEDIQSYVLSFAVKDGRQNESVDIAKTALAVCANANPEAESIRQGLEERLRDKMRALR